MREKSLTIINSPEGTEFRNTLHNLEIGWTNHYWYNVHYQTLLKLRDFAFKYKREFFEAGYDIISIYQQLDEFEKTITEQSTITKTREEASIFAAIKYAEEGKPIIFSYTNKLLGDLHTSKIKEKDFQQYRYDTIIDLLYFYIQNKNDAQCVAALDGIFGNALVFYSQLKAAYPDEAAFDFDYIVTSYLKILYKNKKFDLGRSIIEKYTFVRENEQTEKLKIKFINKLT